MLYLVIGHPKEGRTLPPKREFLELVVKEWEAVIAQRDQGKVVDVYGFDDGTGGIIICEAGSKEKVVRMLMELPLYDYANWEIKELMSAEEGLASAKRKLFQAIDI